MAIHDHDRTPRDYMRDEPSRYQVAGTGTGGILVGLAVIAVIFYMFFTAANSPSTTGDAVRQTPQNPTTTTAPHTTTPTPTGPTTQPQ